MPRRDDGTLLNGEEWRAQFPTIPGAALPSGPNGLPLLDFGAQFAQGIQFRRLSDKGLRVEIIQAIKTE